MKKELFVCENWFKITIPAGDLWNVRECQLHDCNSNLTGKGLISINNATCQMQISTHSKCQKRLSSVMNVFDFIGVEILCFSK